MGLEGKECCFSHLQKVIRQNVKERVFCKQKTSPELVEVMSVSAVVAALKALAEMVPRSGGPDMVEVEPVVVVVSVSSGLPASSTDADTRLAALRRPSWWPGHDDFNSSNCATRETRRHITGRTPETLRSGLVERISGEAMRRREESAWIALARINGAFLHLAAVDLGNDCSAEMTEERGEEGG